jgi:tRNA dimethylallyltransferase
MSLHLSLVGPTASGKSALAEALFAKRPSIELVSVDAIAVYRGLDIGSAKPVPKPTGPRWHLIDVVEPTSEFSVAEFDVLVQAAVREIERRGHDIVAVGGTGLYHRAVVDELGFPGRYPEVAAGLETEADEPDGLAHLYARLVALDPLGASRIEPTNRRRIIRALEVSLGSGEAFSSFGPGLSTYPVTRWRIVGIAIEREELDRRIAERLERQLKDGFVEEVVALIEAGVLTSRTARQALGYRELIAWHSGTLSLEEAKSEILRRSRRFARRQQSWFARDPRVSWISGNDEELLDQLLRIVEEEDTRTGMRQ